MAIRNNKPVQIMDLGAYSIKVAVLKYSKEADEMVVVSKEVYKVPNSWAGVDTYMESLGNYFQDLAPKLDKKLPIRFTVSSLFTPTNISYLTRIDKTQIQTKVKEEMEKFATQEKLPVECPHHRYYELFTKEIEDKAQVISASTLLNPKYVAIIKKHLYASGLKFGGIYPVMYSVLEFYKKLIQTNEALREEPICFVDIGHLTTKVNLFFQEKLIFNKILHFGTKNFADELFDYCSKAGETSIAPSDVELMIQKVGFSGDTDAANELGLQMNDPAPYLRNINETLKSIFQKVQTSVSYFGTALARNFTVDNAAFAAIRKGPTHMFVSGGVTNAPKFVDKLYETFGASMGLHLMQPFDVKGTMAQNRDSLAKEELRLSLRENGPFADVMMTSVVALESVKNSYNLVSQVDSENENILKVLMKMPLVRYRNILAACLAIVVLKIGWSWISTKLKLDSLKKESSKLASSLSGVSGVRTRYHELLAEQVKYQTQFGFVKMHLSNYPHWPSVLKRLMQKVGPEIKVNNLKFNSEQPGFDFNKYRRWKEDSSTKDNPWTMRKIVFRIDGIALTRQAVPKLIEDLKALGSFDIPKPPSTKFIPEQVKKTFDRVKNQDIIETVAAHYEFSLEGTVSIGNTI